MSIDPNTLPDGTVIETVHGTLRYLNGVYNPSEWGHEVTRAYVPVPDDMTYADAEAALADAGAWVEAPEQDIPFNARVREEYRGWQADPGPGRFYVHRDDLPPTDPDAELVEKMARASYERSGFSWGNLTDRGRASVCADARAALAVVREHEATR